MGEEFKDFEVEAPVLTLEPDLTEEKADIYEQLAQLNKQIRAERQKIKLCREIADSAAVMQRDVAAQEKSRHEKESSQTRDHE